MIIINVGTHDVCISANIWVLDNNVLISVSDQFSSLSWSGSEDFWQQDLSFFFAFMSFQQRTELPGSARNTPASHQHTAPAELGHLSLTTLNKSHTPELLKTPNPWIIPCFHSNWSGATLFLLVWYLVHQHRNNNAVYSWNGPNFSQHTPSWIYFY